MSVNKITIFVFLLTISSKLALSELIPCTDGKDDWFTDNGYCYRFVEIREGKTWDGANQYCKDLKANLLSIESKEENDYIKSVFEAAELIKKPTAWIGLRAYYQEPYQWSDGSAFDFANWKNDVVPKANKETLCVAMLDSGSWAGTDCEIMMQNFICKKDNTTINSTLEPPVREGNCLDEHWFKFKNKCYRPFSDRDGGKNFNDAVKSCQEFNATLASIHSEEEQDFMTVSVGAFNASSWVGLKTLQRKHAWIDGSTLNYTNWAAGEPSNPYSEPCVEMFNIPAMSGKWNDVDCGRRLGYICQLNSDPKLPPTTPIKTNCPEGFFRYQKSCFKVEHDEMDWASAEKRCQSYSKGHLLRIGDPFDQAYSNLLSMAFKDKYWIGFSDNDQSKNGLFTWTDGWPAYFTKWGENQPQASPLFNRCVSVDKSTHRWSVSDCSSKLPFICRINDDSPPDVPLIVGNCPPDTPTEKWIDVGNNYCYVVESRGKTSWNLASETCNNMVGGAKLASFHNQHELDLIKSAIVSAETSVWIGLSRDSRGGYKWQDGTAADFLPWDNGEPSNAFDEKCVEILGNKLKYNNIPCYKTRGYICEVKKTPVPSTLPPTTTLAPRTDCGPEFKNWSYFDENCYYFHQDFQGRYSWYDANDFCNNNGAHLVSIHSVEENNFVFDSISATWRYFSKYWIGLNAVNNEAFEWTDDTLLNFDALTDSDETRLLKDQKCSYVSRIVTQRAQWNLDMCSKNLSFVCKRPFGVAPTVITPKTTTRDPGLCPNYGWTRIGNKCIKLFGETTEDRLNFSSALDSCKTKGNKGTLMSIQNEREQTTATSLLWGVNVNVWIGLQKKSLSAEFVWTDGSRFLYQNWAPGQPNQNIYANSCTMLEISRTEPGKWANVLIGRDKLAYMCQITPSTSIVTTPPTEPDCWTTEPGFMKYGNSCYKIYKEQKETWEDADTKCQKVRGRLASINNGLDENFIRSNLIPLNGSIDSVWLGLSAEANSRRFKWIDQWPVYFTNWGVLQPQPSDQKRCVYIDVNSLEWNSTTSCQEKRSYICKTSKDQRPIIPIEPDSVCPSHLDANWQDFGSDYCYYIESGKTLSKKKNWGDAAIYCHKYDAELASIHSQHEVDLIGPHTKDSGSMLWIGLLRKHHGEFVWYDETPSDFELWDAGQPVQNVLIGCGTLNPKTGKWSAIACSTTMGFICRIKKVPKITTNVITTSVSQSSKSSSEPTTPSPISKEITTKKQELTTEKKTVTPKKTTMADTTVTEISTPKFDDLHNTAGGLGGGAVAGIVIAVLGSMVVVAGILFYLKKQNRIPNFWHKKNGYTNDVE